jgi:hypothetical protein
MNRCEVLTPWVSVNGRNVAQVIVDQPAAAPGSWTDTTGQATVPPASAGQPLTNTADFLWGSGRCDAGRAASRRPVHGAVERGGLMAGVTVQPQIRSLQPRSAASG